MPRPRKPRRIRGPLLDLLYKPHGVALPDLRGVVLSHDGLEALRLADAEGHDHETAAAMMDVSRPTFSRLLAEARQTVATALTQGWALRIDGGDFRLGGDDWPEGESLGRGRGRGRRRCGRRACAEDGQKEE